MDNGAPDCIPGRRQTLREFLWNGKANESDGCRVIVQCLGVWK